MLFSHLQRSSNYFSQAFLAICLYYKFFHQKDIQCPPTSPPRHPSESTAFDMDENSLKKKILTFFLALVEKGLTRMIHE